MKRTATTYLGTLTLLAAGLLASSCIIVSEDDDDDDGGSSASTGGKKSTDDGGAAGDEGTGGSVEAAGGEGGAAPKATAGAPAEQAQGGAAGAADVGAGGAGGAATARSASAQIEGASFVGETAPDPEGDVDAPGVESPEAVIAGGTADYVIALSGTDLEAILVALTGDDGYFVVPVSSDSGEQIVSVTLLPEYEGDTLGIGFALRDNDGNVSEWTKKDIPVEASGTGDVKVSLTFTEDEDLDLHVTDPLGNEIYYGKKEVLYDDTGEGAHLDVDSNAGCSIDGINNENIFWDSGSAPSGEYKVEVNYYQHCAATSVNYTVSVFIGDDIKIYKGSFVAADESVTHDVTTFEY